VTSVEDNLKIYNQLKFIETLPKRTRKMLFNIRALVSFQLCGLFCITWLTPRTSNFGLIPEKCLTALLMKITIRMAVCGTSVYV
jgi:hypothetical protein